MFISSAFAQTAPAAAEGGLMGSLTGMLPLVLMFVVLYFVMIRPQKEHRAMVEALAKGDEVATAGGFLGRVVDLDEQFLFVEIASGVKVQIQRSAVVQVLPKGTVK